MQSRLRATRVAGARRAVAPASRRLTVNVINANVLIANTKGGGHAFIGLYLAKELLRKGHQVTIMNDGDEAKLTKKAPFSKYAELAHEGATIAWGDPTNPSTYPRGNFDVVYDNNGKDLASCQPLIDHFKHRDLSHYVFVSSAGAYSPHPLHPEHTETDTRKPSAGHTAVEAALAAARLPYTVFQPLYVYGPYGAKDCEQWFIDRIIRDRPVPLPSPGTQLTSLTHVADLAALLAAVPGNRRAVGQSHNACSDRCITFAGICRAVGRALGKQADIVLYEPEQLGLGKGGKAEGFPFRTGHFFASCDKAKRDLGWRPQHSFLADVEQRVEEYVAQGRASREVDFSIDDKILAALGRSTAAAPTTAHSPASSPLSNSSSNSNGSSDASRFTRVSSPASSASSASSVPRRPSHSPRRDLRIHRTPLPPNWREQLQGGEGGQGQQQAAAAGAGRRSATPGDWRKGL
ncbi:hypothetical protein Agub_g3312 [Astrephomene gubernaculifera]|uniref:NAD-dependent epimerase/dehydratase domain-containing protein n=1 Tax=Astrephomene gubernaculifera TaxID=47775 RepID=A0AAD3HIT0_9CHLO|nr:hypothetical protein Agub_g3312 [Astrephomene gubernaculifera]